MIRDRITIIKEKYKDDHHEIDYQCDLCDKTDKTNYPMVSWACENDDPYIKTIVCIPCLKKAAII